MGGHWARGRLVPRLARKSVVRLLAHGTDRDIASGLASGPCWIWRGYIEPSGYGRLTFGGVRKLTHRWAYEIMVGPVPPGLELDHLCRNRSCCNPLHLEPVTTRTNILRGQAPAAHNARKTHCKRGHELTVDNIYVRRGQHRECATCRSAAITRYSEERKAGRAARRRP